VSRCPAFFNFDAHAECLQLAAPSKGNFLTCGVDRHVQRYVYVSVLNTDNSPLVRRLGRFAFPLLFDTFSSFCLRFQPFPSPALCTFVCTLGMSVWILDPFNLSGVCLALQLGESGGFNPFWCVPMFSGAIASVCLGCLRGF